MTPTQQLRSAIGLLLLAEKNDDLPARRALIALAIDDAEKAYNASEPNVARARNRLRRTTRPDETSEKLPMSR